MTSPASLVISAFKTMGLMDFLMYRTDPSAMAALNPSGVNPPSSGNGAFGSKGRSSGLVQGMSRLASTARIVLDVPSVICAIFAPPSAPPSVGGPLKRKYEGLLRLVGVPSGPG